MLSSSGPIGVFDSGLGGLSVLRHIRTQLPTENLIYFADSGYAPYGDKPEEFVIERSFKIAGFLLERDIKALVVACNTATAAAIPAGRNTGFPVPRPCRAARPADRPSFSPRPAERR